MTLRAMFAAAALFCSGLAFAEGVQYRLAVDGLACPFCAYGIEKQLDALEGVDGIETRIKDGVVIVTMAEGRVLTEAAARRAVRDAGFSLRGFETVEP